MHYLSPSGMSLKKSESESYANNVNGGLCILMAFVPNFFRARITPGLDKDNNRIFSCNFTSYEALMV